MLTGKQKRYLRAMGNEMDPIIQIGKSGITDTLITQTDETVEARELIKCRVLQNCSEEPKIVAKQLAEDVEADLVQVIGRNFLLFRASKDKPVIVLP